MNDFGFYLGLDTLNFRLNFKDFPKNRYSTGTGIIYTSNDAFAQAVGKLNGQRFMGTEITVHVKETST